MKSLAIAEKYGLPRHVAHQAYYSLAGSEYEWELMPLAIDQKVGLIVWSPLAQGRLTGKLRRNQPAPQDSRLRVTSEVSQSGDDETLYRIIDAMDAIGAETGKVFRRSRSTGCSSAQPYRRSFLVRATKPSCARISARPIGI